MSGSRDSKGVSDRASTTIRSSTGFFSLGWTARCGHFCCTEGNSSSNSSCTSSGAARLTLSGRHALPGTNCPPGLLSAVLAAAAAAAGANAGRLHLQQLLSSPPVAATGRRYRFRTASVSVSAKRGGLMWALQTHFIAHTILLPGFATVAAPSVAAFVAVPVSPVSNGIRRCSTRCLLAAPLEA